MKPERRIILKLFLNFNDFEPQYSYKLCSYKKECNLEDQPCLRKSLVNTFDSPYSPVKFNALKVLYALYRSAVDLIFLKVIKDSITF